MGDEIAARLTLRACNKILNRWTLVARDKGQGGPHGGALRKLRRMPFAEIEEIVIECCAIPQFEGLLNDVDRVGSRDRNPEILGVKVFGPADGATELARTVSRN